LHLFIFIFFVSFISLNANENLLKVSLQLSWFNQFQFAGYYIAKEKGFYKEYGLDVEIKEFDFEIDVLKEVNENKSDFGIAREDLIPNKFNFYNDLIALFPIFQVSPLILISKKESQISNIKNFPLKKLMITEPDSIQASIKAMLISNNVPINSITFLKHSHNINDLIENRVDIMSAYISKSPLLLQKKLIPYNIFSPKDYGFDMYSDYLFTNKNLTKQNKDKVIAFKKASLLGWEYAYNHIEESIDLIFKKYNSQNLTKEELLFEANELKKLSYYKSNILGNVDRNKLARIFDIYNLMGEIKNPINIDDFIFDENKPILNEDETNYLKNKDTLKLCVRKNFLPYEAISNENLIGINLEYINILEKRLGKNIDIFKINTLNEGISDLNDNLCDFISIFEDENNSKSLLTKPYLQLPLVLVTKNTNSFITNFEQLKNKTIFISKNEALVHILNKNYPNINLYITNSPNFAYQQILSNKADGYIGNIVEVIYSLQKEYNSDLNITGNFDYKINLLFAVKNENLILQNILNKVINNISKEESELILNSYTLLKYKEIKNYKSIIIVTLSSFFIILLLLIVYLRESILKKRIEKLNEDLEKRILEESSKNRKKDEILFRQAKLASMGEMINNIAHQWRQPLNRINLSIQVIESIIKENLASLKKEDLITIDRKIFHINKNVTYMSNTIEDFMNFFHPNKEKNHFFLNHVLDKAISLVQDLDKNIHFRIKSDKQINILSFENELLQVLLIILENAIDNFKLSNQKNKTITIICREEYSNIILTLKDNSGGISLKIIDKIFDPYFTTKFKKEGSGLGLYMAKLLIEQSIGGKLDVFSKDIFTKFRIILPKESYDKS
jgi:signal transduction histidine kinase/ABC-type nitrate/sulfonate/bicarbonate transport system substrate-binding protein